MTGKRSRTFATLIASSVIAFAMAFTMTRAASPTLRQQVEYLPSATEWVPFSAVIRVTHAGSDGGKSVTKRFYQNKEGSTRFESTSPDGAETAVTIYNYEARMAFAKSPKTGEWAKLPYTRPARIRRVPVNMPGLSASPDVPRLGFEVYRLTMKTGTIQLLAPALNLFSLLTELPTGRREEVISVIRGEPAGELFLPPPGVAVRLAADENDLVRTSARRP